MKPKKTLVDPIRVVAWTVLLSFVVAWWYFVVKLVLDCFS